MTRDFRPGLQVPAAARRFCSEQLLDVLADGPAREDVLADAALVVSELLTNAIRAGCSTARLALAVHRDVVRISVADDAPGVPSPRSPGDVSDIDTGIPGGWGLGILSHLADEWAVEQLIPGKEVWVELPIPSELTLDMASCHHPVRFDPSVSTAIDPPKADLGDTPEPAV